MTHQIKELVLATHNEGKIAEMQALLGPLGITLYSAKDFDAFEPDENGTTYEENALIKAKYFCDLTGKPCLADDSGFNLHGLGGFPGLDSGPYIRSFETVDQCFQELVEKLQDNTDWTASFKAVLCLCLPNIDPTYYTGVIEGKFVYPARGKDGFYFDSVFQPRGYDKTFAELGHDVKNKISHRAIALKAFVDSCRTTQ